MHVGKKGGVRKLAKKRRAEGLSHYLKAYSTWRGKNVEAVKKGLHSFGEGKAGPKRRN